MAAKYNWAEGVESPTAQNSKLCARNFAPSRREPQPRSADGFPRSVERELRCAREALDRALWIAAYCEAEQ